MAVVPSRTARLDVSRLRREQVLEKLEAIGYLVIIRHVGNGPVVELTRIGRDYLIAEGLV